MSRDRLNRITRIVLLIMIAATALLIVVAARPKPQPFSVVEAEIGKPTAIPARSDNPVAYVTATHPAVVTFPADWNIADQVCIVVRFDRGTATPSLPYDDSLYQSLWDTDPGNTIVFDYESVWSRSPDGSYIKVDEQPIADQIVPRTGYRVKWIGIEPLVLGDNQAGGGLFCYHYYFYIDNQDIYHLPFWHQVGFIPRNADVRAWPAFSFRYNADPAPSDPPFTVTLHREELNDYLAEVAKDSPFAVTPLTASQKQQLATEIPSQMRDP